MSTVSQEDDKEPVYSILPRVAVAYVPICSNKHSPLYHFVRSLDCDLAVKFSPLRPLVGIKATSLSCKRMRTDLVKTT